VIVCLAVSVEHQLVTDGQTDRRRGKNEVQRRTQIHLENSR